MRSEDGFIVQRCLSGDAEAFGLLVDKYKSSVYALAFARLRNFHDAQDITQEVFIRVYKKLHTFRRWDNFAGWLYVITDNLCKDLWRSRNRRLDQEHLDEHAKAIDSLSLNAHQVSQEHELLHDALASLPQQHAEVLALHYFSGLSTRQIAELTLTRPNTVAQRLRRARQELKAELLQTLGESYEEAQLQPHFTFRVLALVKQIRVRPVRRVEWFPWGLSSAATIVLTVVHFSFFFHLYTGIPSVGHVPTVEAHAEQPRELLVTFLRPPVYEWAIEPAGLALEADGGTWDADGVRAASVLIDYSEPTNSPERYKMWYAGRGGSHQETGYAISPDGIHWTKYPEPVLRRGIGFDAFHADQACVLIDPNEPVGSPERFKMWYVGYAASSQWQIGHATSPNGKDWVKHDADDDGFPDPVFRGVSASGAAGPCVLIDNSAPDAEERFKMWYHGSISSSNQGPMGIFYATSPDGIHWIPFGDSPLFDPGNRAANPSVAIDPTAPLGERYRMWFDTSGFRIGYATSHDGIHWWLEGTALCKGTSPWNDRAVFEPTILVDGRERRMWFTADGTTTPYQIGHTESAASADMGNIFASAGSDISSNGRR